MNSIKDLFEETEKCISCGFCEAVCPTLPSMNYRSIYGARGRVLLAREVVKNINESGKVKLKINDPFYTCLGCYACFYVCPAGVNAGKVSEMVKDIVTEKKICRKTGKKYSKNDQGINNEIPESTWDKRKTFFLERWNGIQ
jgi:glycolate oxidase iron-sulfur subunit